MILMNELDQPIVVSEVDAIRAGKFEGFVEDLPFEEYVKAPYASQSFLKTMREQSPRHAMEERLRGSKPTPSQEFGTLFHTALLEPERYAKEYCCEPRKEDYPGALVTGADLTARCKQLGIPSSGAKEVLATRIAETDPKALIWDWIVRDAVKGRIAVSADDAQAIERMVASVLSIPDAEKLIRHPQAKREVSAFAFDPQTGVGMKARFDVLRMDRHIPGDIKTSKDASFDGFQKAVRTYKYHWQTAMYLDVYNLLTGAKTDMFPHVAVENEAPYEAALFALDNATIEAGRSEYRFMLAEYAECLRKGEWHGYPKNIQTMNLLYF